jgi:hypothetical protein
LAEDCRFIFWRPWNESGLQPEVIVEITGTMLRPGRKSENFIASIELLLSLTQSPFA